MVGHGNNKVIERQLRLRLEQSVPQPVLIHGARVASRALVGQEGKAEKAGLLNQAVGAAVQTTFSAQLCEDRLRESPHRRWRRRSSS